MTQVLIFVEWIIWVCFYSLFQEFFYFLINSFFLYLAFYLKYNIFYMVAVRWSGLVKTQVHAVGDCSDLKTYF